MHTIVLVTDNSPTYHIGRVNKQFVFKSRHKCLARWGGRTFICLIIVQHDDKAAICKAVNLINIC